MPETASDGTAHEAETAQLPQSTSPVVGIDEAGRLDLRQRRRRLDRGDQARTEPAVVAHAVDVEAVVGGVGV